VPPVRHCRRTRDRHQARCIKVSGGPRKSTASGGDRARGARRWRDLGVAEQLTGGRYIDVRSIATPPLRDTALT
jgi:hypothetical protein